MLILRWSKSKAILSADIKNAERCDVDDFIKHFLYLVLKDHCETKSQINEIQSGIEKLQYERYYPNMDTSTTGEKEGIVSEEERLVKEMANILDSLLEKSLKAVLPLANDETMRSHLRDYLGIKSSETARYAPYASLCNDALATLAKLDDLNDEFREPDALRIHFARSDPGCIQSSYKGVDGAIDRKPDVICTSRLAASDAYKTSLDSDKLCDPCREAPDDAFTWEQVLSCHEFKLTDHARKEKFKTFWKAKGAQYTYSDHQESSKENWDHLSDIVEEENPTSNSQQAAGKQVSEHKPMGSAQQPESQSAKVVSARLQCASYSLEMLSHNLGVHHAINLLIIDDVMWIWYFDRQGIVYSRAISFIRELSRFLVLLFAFQRFSLEDWGVISILNPNATRALQATTDATPTGGNRRSGRSGNQAANAREQRRSKIFTIDIKLSQLQQAECFLPGTDKLESVSLELARFLSSEPRCIAGRATAVIEVKGKMSPRADSAEPVELPMVCKLYHPEIQRRHEGAVIETIRLIAESEAPDMLDHLPTLYFYGDLPRFTTNRIRSIIGISWKAHRTTRLIGLKALQEITTLTSGPKFTKAWLDVVTCHTFLWKNHVEHGDPSVDNMMYDPESRCGVLTDFDLSLLQWEPRIFGTDRTATVPFMAIDLLTDEYWKGTIKRYYHHELESFIWVIVFVFLLYQDGKRQSNKYATPWMTSNYNICRIEKVYFYSKTLGEVESSVQRDYATFWLLPRRLCASLALQNLHRSLRELPEYGPKLDHLQESENMWQSFVAVLHGFVKEDIGRKFSDQIDGLQKCKPGFKEMNGKVKEGLRKKYSSNIT